MATSGSPIYEVPELTGDNKELLVLANYESGKKFDANNSKLDRYLGAMTEKAIITNIARGNEPNLQEEANSASLLTAFKADTGFGRFKTGNTDPVKLQGATFLKANLLAVYLQLKKDGTEQYNTVDNIVGGENKEKINPINRIYVYDNTSTQIAIKDDDPADKSTPTVVTDQYYRIEIKGNKLNIYIPGPEGINITKKIVGELSYTLSKLLKALLEVELKYGDGTGTIGAPEDTRAPGERVVGGKKSKKHRKRGGKKSKKRRSMRRLKRSRARK